MSKKLDLTGIAQLLDKGKEFELTDAKYEKMTGKALPKDKSYIKNRSALAKLAGSKGYYITVVEKKVILKKTK